MKLFIVRVSCPDWLDVPLMTFIVVMWIGFIVGLAITYSPWWLFLLILAPKFKRDNNRRAN